MHHPPCFAVDYLADVPTDGTLRCRPADRLGDDVAAMLPLPARAPDTDRRWVLPVPADAYPGQRLLLLVGVPRSTPAAPVPGLKDMQQRSLSRNHILKTGNGRQLVRGFESLPRRLGASRIASLGQDSSGVGHQGTRLRTAVIMRSGLRCSLRTVAHTVAQRITL